MCHTIYWFNVCLLLLSSHKWVFGLFQSDHCNVTNSSSRSRTIWPPSPSSLPPILSDSTIIIIQLSPPISSQRMTPQTTISCLRCTNLGRECCVRHSVTDILCRSTYLWSPLPPIVKCWKLVSSVHAGRTL